MAVTFFAPALLLATTLRVVVPSFQVDSLPAFVAPKMAKLLAAEVNRAGCAVASAESELPASAQHDLDDCYGQPSCLASVGANLGVQKLVLGTVRRDASTYSVRMLVVDVARRRVQRGVTDKLTARPDLLPLVARRAAKPLCDIFLGGDELPLEEVHLEVTPPPEFGTLPVLPDDLDLDLDVPSAKALAQAHSHTTPGVTVAARPPSADASTTASMVHAPPPAPPMTAPARQKLPVFSETTSPPPPQRSAVPSGAGMRAAMREEPPPALATTGSASITPSALSKHLQDTPRSPPAKPVAMPKWNWFVLGGGGVALIAGATLGGMSTVTLAADHPGRNEDGITHTITRATLLRANALATSANVLFGVGLIAGAVGGTVVVLSDRGIAVGGRF